MMSNIFPFFLVPVMLVVYLAIPILIIYFVNKWVNQFLNLRQEQNYLLRELIKKMDNK